MALTNYKTVFRVDYKPTLDFYGKMFPIASALQGYPDWHTNGHSVTLQNLALWCSFHLGHNLFVYARDMKQEGAVGEDKKRIRAIIGEVAPKLEKHEYTQVGLHCWFLFPVAMSFENLVTVVSEKFFLQSKEIKEGICPAATDVAYSVHFLENELEVQLRAGPMRRSETELQFRPDRFTNFPADKQSLPPDELYSDFPEVSLLIDIDVSKKNVAANDLGTVYTDAQVVQSKLSLNIVKYVFGLKE